MGFGVNNFNNNKPIIKGAQAAQDGGAGNLGYFEQEEGKNKKKEDEKKLLEEEQEDQFIRHDKKNSEDEEDLSLSKIIAQIILDIKDWFKQFFKTN